MCNHTVRSAIDLACLRELSLLIIYLDLEKAFDFVIREYVMSWSQDFRGNPYEHLVSLGLSPDEVARLVRENASTTSLLVALGVPENISLLVSSLHSNSWAVFDDLKST